MFLLFILVTFKSIQKVPFPSVTVCAPNSFKWPALVEALNYYDRDGLIFQVFDNDIRDYKPAHPDGMPGPPTINNNRQIGISAKFLL